MQPVDGDPVVRAHRYLTRVEKKQIGAQLWEEVTMATGHPVLAHGAIVRCAKNFGVSRPAISRLWQRMKSNFANGLLTSSPLKEKYSRPLLYCRDEMMQQMQEIPHCKRRTLRDLGVQLGIGKSTVHRILKSEKSGEGKCYIVAHTNSVLPELTDEHKVARVLYALSKLNQETGYFSSFLQDVHVDEKWFELTPNRVRVYLTKEEQENNDVPIRKVAHKSHVQKVMFLAATARPRFDDEGNCTFDGKIGIWPIVKRSPALRNSVNRPAGTMVTTPLNVSQRVYRRMLLNDVIPAIKNRFPHHRDRRVTIQQDGASAHISTTRDANFRQELDEIRGKLCCLEISLFLTLTRSYLRFQVFGI